MPPSKSNNAENITEANVDDDYDDIPLEHQRPFGSGLHRRPIAFVSASGTGTLQSVDAERRPPKPQHNVADIYLSMVLSEDSRSQSAPPSTTAPSPPKTSTPTPTSNPPQNEKEEETCPVCRLPLDTDPNPNPSSNPTPHTQSLAHQLCLPHSHPPSALDRTRMGLSYLAAHGWDPDARAGLGAAQQGIAYPVKAQVKDDVLGVGMVVSKKEKEGKGKKNGGNGGRLLDAKKVRKMVGEERRRAVRIREELFGDGRVERYLGRGDSV